MITDNKLVYWDLRGKYLLQQPVTKMRIHSTMGRFSQIDMLYIPLYVVRRSKVRPHAVYPVRGLHEESHVTCRMKVATFLTLLLVPTEGF